MNYIVRAPSTTPETDQEEAELDMARGIMEERGINELPILKGKIVRSAFARKLEVERDSMVRALRTIALDAESLCDPSRIVQQAYAALSKHGR